MKLVVGLGNVGPNYEKTRHNVGFIVLDSILKNLDIQCTKEKYNGKYCEKTINGEKIIFLKPQSYMNNSGIVIKKYIDYFKINLEELFIIYDDMDLEFGAFKLKSSGGNAGHNGLRSIENNLGTKEYKRLKIGISKADINVSDYVLGKFSKEQLKILENQCSTYIDIINDFFILTFSNLMNKYN